MALSEGDRVLRRVTAWGLVWSLCFLIYYGVEARALLAPMLLIPQGISFFAAMYHLSGKATCRQLNIAIDAALAIALLAMIIPVNISIRRAQRWTGDDLLMIGAYGTVPSMINIAIHTFFVFRECSIIYLLNLVFGNLFSSPKCPHCQREVLFKWGMVGSPSTSSVSKESYASIRAHDDDEVEGRPSSSKVPRVEAYKDPRPSTDDESARLV